jgi:methylthioribose-1-phosphate isomerase
MSIQTIKWVNGRVRIIDQTKLPNEFKYIHCRNVETLWEAIKRLRVRGAPALGVAAAFGVVLGLKKFNSSDKTKFLKELRRLCDYIGSSRPTAVNLFNALNQLKEIVSANKQKSVTQLKALIQKEALAIYELDRRVCRQMGDYGTALIKPKSNVMTVCNAGALATVDYGTALGVMYSAKKKGKQFQVYVCETRPLLQGARLTAWELLRAKIPTTLICDNMAATLMKQGKVDAVFTGADRIAANGDTANKIGTYNLAVLAKHHRVPFYIVAPLSTFDPKTATGKQIPIEQRHPSEVRGFGPVRTSPSAVNVYNPAFDVTDNRLITAIVTEAGIIRPPFGKKIKRIFVNSE